jgi:transcriptional regulator with XRE-family HTH domain
MGVEDFAALILRCRKLQRMSQRALSDASGVAVATIQRLEGSDPPVPKRDTAVDLALAVGTDVDAALALLGYEPLTEEEREKVAPPIPDLSAQLGQLWPKLTPRQQQIVVALCASMADPHGPVAECGDPVVVVEVKSGAAARSRSARRHHNHRLS